MEDRLSVLPKDMKIEIILKLEPKDIYNLCDASKKFNTLCSDENLWKLLLERDFQKEYPKFSNESASNQSLYKLLYQLSDLREKLKLKMSLYDLYYTDRINIFTNKGIKKIPKSIKLLQNLQIIYLVQNPLATLPKEIGELKNLKTLTLSENQLTSLPKEIGELKNLESLHLLYNRLTTLPKEIKNLKNLEVLDLYGNQLKSIPKELTQLKNLKSLGLLNNLLLEIPNEIGKLQNLKYLYLTGNKLNSLPKELSQLQKLERLDVDRKTYIPQEILNLKPRLTIYH